MSGEYKSAIHYLQERQERLADVCGTFSGLRENKSNFLALLSPPESHSTWAALHAGILDKPLSITAHLMSLAPQTCLAGCAALGQWLPSIPHEADWLCLCCILPIHL